MKRPLWLFRKFKVGLRTEIILNLTLLMAGALLLVGFGIIKIHERDILEQKVKNGKLIIDSIRNSIHLHGGKTVGSSGTISLIDRVIGLYAGSEEVREITVVDPSQRVIASSLGARQVGRIDDAPMAEAIAGKRVLWEFGREDSVLFPVYQDLRLFAPLQTSGALVGGVYVRLSLADVMKGIIVSQRLILLLVLLDGLVIVLFGSFLLSRIIVRPLKQLVSATEGIARGDYDPNIVLADSNEIGQLADAFRAMTGRLRESQCHVEQYVESLEIANERLQQTQMELIRSEKLASIGRFAAGVAHEVGNPLGAILGYTSILQKDLNDGCEAHEYLSRIEVEIQRINKIIRELLDFSRPSVVEIKEVDLNRVIENCLSLLSFQKSFRNVEPSLRLKGDLPRVEVDEAQIQQVFVNLIINAVDAMPEGGTLTVETKDYILQKIPKPGRDGASRRKDDPADSDYTHLRRSQRNRSGSSVFRTGGGVVCASITDTGTGIRPEDLQRIFDPFFTTKDPNRGTGLGLSISLKILESFGGSIEVESEVGQGSTFRVLLPVSATRG